jgi:hypothetical protein
MPQCHHLTSALHHVCIMCPAHTAQFSSCFRCLRYLYRPVLTLTRLYVLLYVLPTPAVIVKASSGPRYVVGCRTKVDKAKLTSGTRVALDMTTLTIMRALPREVGTVCVRGGVCCCLVAVWRADQRHTCGPGHDHAYHHGRTATRGGSTGCCLGAVWVLFGCCLCAG